MVGATLVSYGNIRVAGFPLPSSPAAMPPSPRGRLLAVAVKFPAEFKGVPLGELPNEVRLRGY